ncbi:MAG: ABC transporter permease [Lachnospiraceae bacterium]|jgi:ABC-type antimicrobial peptide transport system permease subunit|nr:ABC transporter permease [Lachnospiraceae bacterium]
MKILRLSFFNIKRRKREAAILILLTAIAMMLMSVAIINYGKAYSLLEQAFEESESKTYAFVFTEKNYRTEFGELIETDPRVMNASQFELLRADDNAATTCRQKDGSIINLYVSFVTEEGERKYSSFLKETTLSEEEIRRLEHPIWMPQYVQLDMGYRPGEEISLTLRNREFSFQIAGFYETGLFSSAYQSFKCVISETDFEEVAATLGRNVCIAFDLKEGTIHNDAEAESFEAELTDKMSELAGKRFSPSGFPFDNIYHEASTSADIVRIIMLIVGAMAVIVTLTALFMILHKITGDINDQMEQIGVLEALGYRSAEISKAYVYEYLILGAAGCILGSILTVSTNPFMTYVLQVFEGHKTSGSGNLGLMLMPCALLLPLILLTALGKAGTIKKYPPVIAFRKGIKTHHFGKNHLPMEKAKGNINARLGMKELLGNQRQNVGIFLCIVLMGVSVAFCVMIADLFRDGGKGMTKSAGWENSDLYLIFEDTVNVKDATAEIASLPEVRKAIYFKTDNATIKNKSVQALVYKDFLATENLFVTRGWLPEKDNEIAMKEHLARELGYEIGDTMMVKGAGVEKKFVLTGYSISLFDGVYVTEEGMSRITPPSNVGLICVYLKDSVNVADFRKLIEEKYGRSNEEILSAGEEEGSLEERIRAKAEEQMALLISEYGIDNANYAIKIGDQMITGGTGKMRIMEVTSFDELLGAQLGGICRLSQIVSLALAVVVAIIISVILNFLISSTIRRQRKPLGIEKAMGYTTKDIKKQLVMRLMPVIIPGVILGTILSIPMTEFFIIGTFGQGSLQARYLLLVPTAILVLLFTYGSAWVSADKVKKVSVTELMTE